jgi:hypothetical protein
MPKASQHVVYKRRNEFSGGARSISAAPVPAAKNSTDAPLKLDVCFFSGGALSPNDKLFEDIHDPVKIVTMQFISFRKSS